ncbi:hypothetical protein SPI_03786 [Niveomyces insectorum RCEF 264]|uniref:Uncharacterized protein n=1 Tax=Niveomyces insectorum RCEF 264 TaxID=1081102 RepID=A0A167WCU4_9HYPO|nr:hypothetical protein SPI_03786 [Niveomyces insectorum RCEF 264]
MQQQQQQQQQRPRQKAWYASPASSSAPSARSRGACLTCKYVWSRTTQGEMRRTATVLLALRAVVAAAAAGQPGGGGTTNGTGTGTGNGPARTDMRTADGHGAGTPRQMQLPPSMSVMARPLYGGGGGPEAASGIQERSLATWAAASSSLSSSSPRSFLAHAAPDHDGVLLPLHPQQQQQQQQQGSVPNAVNRVFDFASFMWDADDVWQDVRQEETLGGAVDMGGVPGMSADAALAAMSQPAMLEATVLPPNGGGSSLSAGDGLAPDEEAPAAENYRLMDYFIHAVTPPILAEVETQKKWLVMRRVLVSRANASSMLRWAILAFSNFMLVQREGAWLASRQNHYENALAEVLAAMDTAATAGDGGGVDVPTASVTIATTAARAASEARTGPRQANNHNNIHSNDNNNATNNNNNKSKNNNSHHASTAQPLALPARSSTRYENLLATLFFLSYVDILEGRLDAAHANLKRAHNILQSSDNGGVLSVVARQFALWLRLLDARAVSAGGEGLFLSTDDERLLVETPPAGALEAELRRFDDRSPSDQPAGGAPHGGGGGGGDGSAEASDDIEDVLFQILYQPGVLFFQKVQSFMGRISRIDPWHRSRGTVEDEMEVMTISAGIAADLRTLYDNRPVLMDYAVAGQLTAAYVSAQLACTVTRSFRTYLCNYYASKVHLHRVAYKTLPLTREAADALAQIRRLARLLVEALDAEDDALPANMLWPLLMLGSEEQDAGERAWIRAQILRMQRVAGNSQITAQVLAELQARQDAAQARVDIRSVMHAIFNSCFAIL